jgi:hypothetical protein
MKDASNDTPKQPTISSKHLFSFAVNGVALPRPGSEIATELVPHMDGDQTSRDA